MGCKECPSSIKQIKALANYMRPQPAAMALRILLDAFLHLLGYRPVTWTAEESQDCRVGSKDKRLQHQVRFSERNAYPKTYLNLEGYFFQEPEGTYIPRTTDRGKVVKDNLVLDTGIAPRFNTNCLQRLSRSLAQS